jgi:hypothetical protein
VFGPLTESESVDAAMASNRYLPDPVVSDSPKKTLHEKATCGVPVMLAKKVKKEKLEKAKAIRLCSCGEPDGLSSIGEASDKPEGKHCRIYLSLHTVHCAKSNHAIISLKCGKR